MLKLRWHPRRGTTTTCKKMKKHCLTGVAVILLASTQIPYAVPITGNIGFTGGATFNTSSAATATAITSWLAPKVTLDSGVFASPSVFAVPLGSPVTFAPGGWNFNTASAVNNFWSVGGFTFELLSSFILQQGGTPGVTAYVVAEGTGLISGNGYTATPMSWMFTSQDPIAGRNPDSWTFSTSSAAIGGVPDGGSTAILLGAALSGVALLKRKTGSAA